MKRTTGFAVGAACVVLNVGAAELYDHRGPKQDGVFPARDYITDFSLGEKLIVWKTLLPAEGQNTPIVVGKRIFLLCSNGLESDCPELFCLDINSGSVLWRKPVDNLDALPPEQQAEAKALRAKELLFSRKAREFLHRFQMLQGPDPKGGKGVVITDKPEFDKLLAEARELGVLDEEAVQVHLRRDGNFFKRFPFPHMPDKKSSDEAGKVRSAEYKKLDDNDWFRYENWHYIMTFYTGRTYPSAVSDGTHVYVFTQDGTVACFGLDANRRWLVDAMRVDEKGNGNSSLVTASPTIAGDKLIVYHCLETVALDRATGKVLWRHENDIRPAYSEAGSPLLVSVEGDAYLYTGSSYILRLADGKRVGQLKPPDDFKGGYRGYLGDHYDSIVRGNRLWVINNTNGGGGKRPDLFHFVLKKQGDSVVGELKWHQGIEQACVCLEGENLHQIGLRAGQILDAATGAEKTNAKGWMGVDSRGFAVTDSHLVGMASTDVGGTKESGLSVEAARKLKPAGTLLVYDKATFKEVGRVGIPIEPPEGKVLERRIARTASPVWHSSQGGNWGCSWPMPWGNRVIVRNNDAVYCIGMPGTEYKAPEVK